MFIIKTLDSLNKRLSQNKVLTIQQELGFITEVSFSFEKPAESSEIALLEKQLNIRLPKDFKEFLLQSNGADLFTNEKEGTMYEVLNLSSIKENYEDMDYPEKWFPIAYGMDGEVLIINSKEIPSNQYLYWLEVGESFEDALPLKINFEIWLDRLIMAQGSKFWYWPIYQGANFYKAFDLDEEN